MTDSETWESVGRALMAEEIDDRRLDLDRSLAELRDALADGDDLTAEQVEDVRGALRAVQYITEEHVAPVAGADPWDRCLRRMPIRAIYQGLGYRPTDGEPLEIEA